VDYATSYGRSSRRELMPKKKRLKTLKAVQMVKELARERIGAPPVERVVPDGKKKRAQSIKHKPTLGDMLETE
jgi:hypothetical protein